MDFDPTQPFETETLLPETLPDEPFGLFVQWFNKAHEDGHLPNPNAMTLATVDPDGSPSARVVLCKAIEPDPGAIVWYSNYRSRKGRALEANPQAAVVFHWDHDQHQVRIEGVVARTSDAQSDAYFASRAWESRIGAWASHQSEPIASRQALLEQIAQVILEKNIDIAACMRGDPVNIPRPPFWGGYRLYALRVELWAGSTGRVHDRACWTRELLQPTLWQELDADQAQPVQLSDWQATRLSP